MNTFDETALLPLFPMLHWTSVEFIGEGEPGTNAVSTLLLDLVGHSYGTYGQKEVCAHCNSLLAPPGRLSLMQRATARLARCVLTIQRPFLAPYANWIHVVLTK